VLKKVGVFYLQYVPKADCDCIHPCTKKSMTLLYTENFASKMCYLISLGTYSLVYLRICAE